MRRPRRENRPPPLRPLADDEGHGVIEVQAVELPEPPRAMPPRRLREDPVPETLKPVMPAWMSDPVEALKAEAYRRWETTKFHAIRTHIYMLRAVRYSPGGAWRCLVALSVWTRDDFGKQLAMSAAANNQTLSAERQKNDHRRTVKFRFWTSVSAVFTVVLAGLVIPYLLWSQGGLAKPAGGLGLALVVSAVLGKLGEPGDRPIIERATIAEWVRPEITGELLRAAFNAAGLSKPPRVLADGSLQGGTEIELVRDIARKDKHGTEVTLDLPIGITAEEAQKKKAKIASGLSVGRMQVRIKPDPESERRIELYVHDHDPFARESPETPLKTINKLNFWDGFPFGISAEGQEIRLNLLWASMFIGAVPRQGKTFAARLIGAAAALDPHVRLIVFDGAGRGSWTHLAPLCHRYGVGIRDHVFDYLIETLRECVADIDARAEKLEQLATEKPEENPEAKLTQVLARDRAANMPLVLLIIDEIQRYSKDAKRIAGGKRGDIIEELLTDIIKLGPAVGYIPVNATQKPQGDVISTDFRDNHVIRFALKMMTSAGSKTILGEVPDGMDPVQFHKDKHKGVGVLIGADDNELADLGPQIVRGYMMDNDDFGEIARRAYQLRKSLGLLTGYAAGEQPEEREPDLEDVLEIAHADEDLLHPGVVLERLVAVHPERYDGWTEKELRVRLRERYRINTSVQINRTNGDGERNNLRGIRLDDVRGALAKQLNLTGRV